MGCDIHGPEIWGRKQVSTGAIAMMWTDLIARLEWNRDYTCFGVIAGVPDEEVAPVAYPRGFPDSGWFGSEFQYRRFSGVPDPHRSDECGGWHVHYYDGSDCHSASWLTTAELAEAQRRYLRAVGHHNHDIAMALMIMRTAESQGYEDVRLLFCFDN